ncbi:MAG: hypothetical protein S4CHLAM123_15490 [Chlamydiales bacterium]|nr:hypothetical protein [Chlamydiales bacterium]
MSVRVIPSVTVHVWGESSFQKGTEGKRVCFSPGHVALQVMTEDKSVYISFWPPTQHCCAASAAHFHSDYETDQSYERKDSRSYCLAVSQEGAEKIMEVFLDFKSKPYEWSVLGSSILRRPYASNCAGLSLYLLEKGGLYNDSFFSMQPSKLASALFVSATFFGAINFYSYSKVFQLDTYVNQLKNFIGTNTRLEEFNSQGITYLNGILGGMNAISNKKTEAFFALQENVKKGITLLNSTIKTDVTTALQNWLNLTQRHIFKAKVTLAIPFCFSSMLCLIQHNLWLRTVTPYEVEAFAKKALTNQ